MVQILTSSLPCVVLQQLFEFTTYAAKLMVTLGHEGSQRHSALGQLGVEIWANMRFGSVYDIVVQVEATECHLQQLADVAVALEKSFHLDARLLVHGQGGGWAEILHQLGCPQITSRS